MRFDSDKGSQSGRGPSRKRPLYPHTPVGQKVADEVVFRRFQGEGDDFFKSDLTDSTQIFDAHLLENTNFSPSSFHFSVSFYIKICFESDGFIAYSKK